MQTVLKTKIEQMAELKNLTHNIFLVLLWQVTIP